MPFDFKGKKILVTGAGRGIGRGVAITLCKSPCKVYALSRTKEPLDTLVEEYPTIVPIVADVSNWEDTREKLEKLEVLDGLVNNAGIQAIGNAAIDWSKEIIWNLLNTNLLSAINCTQVIAKKMIAAKIKGSIVNVSSITGISSFPKALSYTISKAGLDMVTKQFALELGPYGIRVNSVNPTLVVTPLAAHHIEAGDVFPETITSRTPMGRIMEVQECVDSILYLLSEHSSMVTGHLHVLDGGLLSNITVKV
ncbi:L-xylulose reductase-like [Mercenaria mercenaria]|uniref:L-xylulose reductase-like n=1 Tax=Mercenaria mercenaria TaxID=6596 RepID=UPI00234FAE80|nr:L-xylulose reductase-like [Mercenaria mercenaria]